MIELKETAHSYYCSDSNHYVGNRNGENFGLCEYGNWKDFKDNWLNEDGSLDDDYNHCFRFDIIQCRDSETDKVIPGKYRLWLFFILQRKGIYRPCVIKNINESDMPEISSFLKSRWAYLKNQWEEFEEDKLC